MFSTILNSVAKPIHKLVPLFRTRFTPWNLRALDEAYFTMNDLHRSVHEHFISGLAGTKNATVLEIACGTGWNVPRFQKAGLKSQNRHFRRNPDPRDNFLILSS